MYRLAMHKSIKRHFVAKVGTHPHIHTPVGSALATLLQTAGCRRRHCCVPRIFACLC
jgi:hypothetical protein